MPKEIENRVQRENEDFLFGTTYSRDRADQEFRAIGPYMIAKNSIWSADEPVEVLKTLGIKTDKRRAFDLENMFSGDISGYYYVEAACAGDPEALKWIMGAAGAHLNEHNLTFSHLHRLLPADYLRSFVLYMVSNRFERSFARDIFALLIAGDRFENLGDDLPLRRLTGEEVMDGLIADPRFKATDSSEIDKIILSVIETNPDNAAKVAEQPKLIQWFIGQVMKASKGKASPAVVGERLNAHFKIN